MHEDEFLPQDQYVKARGNICPVCGCEDADYLYDCGWGLGRKDAQHRRECWRCQSRWFETYEISGFLGLVAGQSLDYTRLSREKCVELLEAVSIACHPDESLELLRDAIKLNVRDGTIDVNDVLDRFDDSKENG
jgi:transcriptional regulator NrdR family protein